MVWIFKAIGIWFLLAVLAIINGVARNAYVSPHVGEYAGHVISSIVFSVVIFIVTFLFIRVFGFSDASRFILLGALWTLMTVGFEFIFGHYVAGHPWSKLFADYNIFKGRIWILVLLATFISPYLAAKLRGII